jgi:hypothetical protein
MKRPTSLLMAGVLLAGLLVISNPAPAAPPQAGKEGPVYEVAWPRGPSAVKIIPLGKRLDTLKGKTICELWDYVFRGAEIFPLIEEELTKRYPGIRFVNYEEFGNPYTVHEKKVYAELPANAKKYGCDAFIVGVGC